MDLSDGTYLDKEICAYSSNNGSMWLIVWDGRYNYYLFDAMDRRNVVNRYDTGRMPVNDVVRGSKNVEFYTVFENAIKGICKIVANDGKWVDMARVL